jgi:hypothetical protein
MINIKGIPLLRAEECIDLFDMESILSIDAFLKPKYQMLPDFDGLEEIERNSYLLRNITEDTYLIGLEVITDSWVNPAFCSSLIDTYGLVLKEVHPMAKTGYTHLIFTHITMGYYDFKVTIS